jgi:voltage-gated potassium channel
VTISQAPADRMAPEEVSIYELFIGLLGLMSIVIAALQLVTDPGPSDTVLAGADFLLCMVFLFDFGRSLRRAPVRRDYLRWRGVIDLVSSIPGVFLLRFLRIVPVVRVARQVGATGSRGLAKQMIRRRGEAAGYLIMLGAFVILIVGSYLMAYVEPPAPDSNIKDAGDAFWWAFVTITTVGYGDKFPVTTEGRVIGMVTMATGIAIFGLLTSFITRLFLSEPADKEEAAEVENALHVEVSALRDEIAALRAEVTASLGRT